MKLGTSLRFAFPSSPNSYATFRAALDALPKGGFIERPMGAVEAHTQARNLIEVTAAAREAGLDMLFVGDHHAVPPEYANAFSPIPTLARLIQPAGPMPLGMVLLAPFYNPVLLAEQIGTLAAFAEAPLTIALALGQGRQQFAAFEIEEHSRVGRLEEMLTVLRALLNGEPATARGLYHSLDRVQAGPTPRLPVSIWIAGTVRAAAARAGRLGDGWLTGQNATRADLVEQLDAYRESAASHGRPAFPVLRRDIFVGASDSEAEGIVERILAEGYRGVGLDQLLVGAPGTVIQQLEEYRSLGFDHVLVRHVVGDHELMLGSFRRIGEDVIPALHDLPPLR